MPTSVESAIRSRVAAFADEIIALIRASAVEVVNAALGGTAVRDRRGRAVSARMATRPKGAKRDPVAIARLTETLETFIKKNPGERIEGKHSDCRRRISRFRSRSSAARRGSRRKGRSDRQSAFRDSSLD